MTARTYVVSQRQTRRARATANVKHLLPRRGRGGFYRRLAERRHHGVEPNLIGRPVLPALAIPVSDLIGILLCHDVSSFWKESTRSNQHRLLGGDTRRCSVRYCKSDGGHERVRQVARGVDAWHAGFATLVNLKGNAEGRINGGEAQ